MSGNVFGTLFQVMTFGESHGPYIGVVISGIRPGLPVDVEAIQTELDRRRPGQSPLTSARNETDRVLVISGILEGKTTGTPLCLLIPNRDARSSDYSTLDRILRPGHAGFAFLQKYGVFDYRGGGRASGRETATRVAAGAIAKQLLKERGVEIIGFTRQIGPVKAETVDFSVIEKNAVRAPDLKAAKAMETAVREAQRSGDSLGGIVEVVVKNCPAGLGEPVFHKMEADLAAALMSIGAVKGFEIGSGFRAASQKGSEHNDPYYFEESTGRIRPRSNHAGGVLGGITTGEDIVMRIAVKPPSSIARPQQTVDLEGKPVTLQMKGRHDPCICPRIVPVAEAMVALVLIDHLLMQERLASGEQVGDLTDQLETIEREILLLTLQRSRLREMLKGKMPATAYRRWEKRLRKQMEEVVLQLGYPPEWVEQLYPSWKNQIPREKPNTENG
ncbi:MAG: chorismate synthase [Calditrichia bacterium]